MKRLFLLYIIAAFTLCVSAQDRATNPVIYADVPDMSMVRVGDTYYMSSTTMHFCPGVPIMKSKDLANWEIVSYCYDTLTTQLPTMNLDREQNTYGKGTWASCIRHHDGYFYVSTFAQTTDKTYFFRTRDIESGEWERVEFTPARHDHTFFFDDDNRIYMINGNGRIYICEIKPDLSGIVEGSERVLIDNASTPAGNNIMLGAEGSQLFKVNGKYYLFNIVWPRDGMRTVLVHRADKITGPYEGRVMFQDRGIAQGGLIDTPDGRWFAYLFQDCGAVGRIPFLAPVTWEDGWPVIGIDGKAPDTLDLPALQGLKPGLVCDDEFSGTTLPLQWQWNHNPDNSLWSLTAHPGYLRLTTGRVDKDFTQVKNLLTQRTIGPTCVGTVCLDASGLNDGDFAGLSLYQKKFGQVGLKRENGQDFLLMINGETETPVEVERIPLKSAQRIWLKAEADFRDRTDRGYFYYSLDGKRWQRIGNVLQMEYTLPHFVGQRFALFCQSTEKAGGHADFDYFHIAEGPLSIDSAPILSDGLSSYFSPVQSGGTMPDADGFIRRWLLLDPIKKENPTNAVFTDSYLREVFSTEYFPNQQTLLPHDGSKVKVGSQRLTWHGLDSNLFNVKLFRFADGFKQPVYGVLFHAVTVVNCTEDVPNVRLSVGSNSASMWWVNGEEALLLSGDRRMVADDCVSPRLTLKKGANIVRGAVINGPGMSDFCLRFIDDSGNPVRNLSITLK